MKVTIKYLDLSIVAHRRILKLKTILVLIHYFNLI